MPDWINDHEDGFRYYCKRCRGLGWVVPAEHPLSRTGSA
jgi:hypothetical protein